MEKDKTEANKDVLIFGAGITGLTAAFFAQQNKLDSLTFEKDKFAGGLAKTIQYGDFKFDLGGHRFVTHHTKLFNFITKLLDDEYVTVKRSSKIYLNDRFINYPLEPINAFIHTGIKNTLHIISDYLKENSFYRNRRRSNSLEDWIVSHYGERLYQLFFKNYSEKVWGLDCSRIDKEWIIQRIQGMSLGHALKRAIFQTKRKRFKTLADEFLYPTNGIGDIVDKLCCGIDVDSLQLDSKILRINHSGKEIVSVDYEIAGKQKRIIAKQYINTIPLTQFVKLLHPALPDDVCEAANNLRSRDMVIVTLFINKPQITKENWIYFPDKSVPFGRIHEPPNWSPAMSPAGKTSVVVEYFCFENDAIWRKSNQDIVDTTIQSLHELQLLKRNELIGSKVVKIRHAYPLFEINYQRHCGTLCRYLDRFENLNLAGRSGMFRYYNLDQAMLSGIDSISNILQIKDNNVDVLLNRYLASNKGSSNEVCTGDTCLAT